MPGQRAASCARHGSVRRQAMSETAVRGNRCASSRVAARHRRATPTSRRRAGRRRRRSPRARGESQSGWPRQRQNAGRSEMSSGSTTDAGWFAASPRSRSSITSESTSRPPGSSKSRIVASASTRAPAAGERHEDDRARRVPLGETREHALRARRPTRAAPRRGGSSCSSGAPARRRPPRGSASARACARSRRRRPSVPPQCLRHERPSRWTSSSDRAGPQLPAG